MTRRLTVPVLCLLTLALSLAIAAPAQAGKGVISTFGSGGTEAGQFANAAGTAVDTSTGDVYVSDQFNNRVERFDKDGAFISTFGWGVNKEGKPEAEVCTEECQAGQEGSGTGQLSAAPGIAIDQTTQQLYVVDQNNNRVEKFDSEGHFLSAFGEAGSGEGQLSSPQGIAVDPTDQSVYVADFSNQRVEHFDKAGAYLSTFGSEGTEDGQFQGPTRVAVDSTGRVYVIDSGNVRIERFTSAGVFEEVFDTTDVFFPQEIAIGPANDHLYVAQWAQDFSEQRVVEIDSTGTLVDTHAVGSTANNSSGLALGPGNQRIYLADGFNARVFVLGEVNEPQVGIEPPSAVTGTGASLSGSVTPGEGTPVSWRFELSTSETEGFSPVGEDQSAGSGTTPVPVTGTLTGLIPNSTYYVRLVAFRVFNEHVTSEVKKIETPALAPSVTTQVADDVTPEHAVLTGLVNPNNSPTSYWFEYGTTTSYGTSVPATQDADAGAANEVEAVLRRIDGLSPGTVYHFRLVAKNQAGTTNDSDQTFTTGTPPAPRTPRAGIPGSGLLPDDRGWEQVTPVDKNGGDAMADSSRTRIAADGSAANFSSLTGFGDAVGTSIATDYESIRSPEGWTTHSIFPPQQPLSGKSILLGLQSLYIGAFSENLTKGVFLGVSPVTNDPNVANVANLYRRTDLETPGAGSYDLLSVCPQCAKSGPLPPLSGEVQGGGAPFFAGASADYGHVIFEANQPLTEEAPAGCTELVDTNQCPGNLYEWDHGTLRSVGLVPPPGQTTCGPEGPACEPSHGSQAGQGAGSYHIVFSLTPNTISADGTRIFFTVPVSPGSLSGALYMRFNHTTTVQLNTSERTGPPVGGSSPAAYWGASSDGTRVFFSTPDALTNDAHVGGNSKLYTYDTSKPASDPHNLTVISADHEPADGNALLEQVVGVSSDGHYVYFASQSQLVAGQPVGGLNIFVSHDGELRYIARETDGDTTQNTNTTDWQGPRPTARVTPDGQHLLFSTVATVGPTGYDQGHCNDTNLGPGCRELYLYNYATKRIVCVSCNPTGAPATASAATSFRENNTVALQSSAQNHPLSDDGRRVFFSTTEALVPEDVNGKLDVYEYEAETGTVHLISNGTERSDSFFMNASPSGNDVLFMTRGQLVGLDTDNNYDLYDARIGGGFPEPTPTPPPCSGDSCQGALLPPPEPPLRGSSLVTGTTNNPPPAGTSSKPKGPVRCRRGYVHKRVKGKLRCVKKRRSRAAHKAASHSRIVGRHK